MAWRRGWDSVRNWLQIIKPSRFFHQSQGSSSGSGYWMQAFDSFSRTQSVASLVSFRAREENHAVLGPQQLSCQKIHNRRLSLHSYIGSHDTRSWSWVVVLDALTFEETLRSLSNSISCFEFKYDTEHLGPWGSGKKLVKKFGCCLPPSRLSRIVLTRGLFYRIHIQQKQISLWFSPSGPSFYLFLLKVSYVFGGHRLGKISSLS